MLRYIIIIAIVVLVIVFLLILENRAAKKKNMKLYTFSDSITNLSLGMLERVFDVFFSVIVFIGFDYIQKNIAPFQIEFSITTWLIGLLVTDFIAYWFHRLSHEVNFLWAAHIVHHQSEELNLTTVSRVSFVAVVFRSFFFVWMALIGFDIFTIITTGVFLGAYQFLTHSRVIGKLGVLEKFITTPSHHRVHHARNEKYMDRNYAHIFIFWDRLFGTFCEEEEEPEYGITSGFERANPFKAVFSYWENLFTRAQRTKTAKNKVSVFTKGPAWTPDDTAHLKEDYKIDENGLRIPHKINVEWKKIVYIMFNLAITVSGFVALLVMKSRLGPNVNLQDLLLNRQVLSLVFLIVISVYAHSRMIEEKKYILLTDSIRLISVVALTIFGFYSLTIGVWLIPVVVSYCLLMFIWLWRLYPVLNNK